MVAPGGNETFLTGSGIGLLSDLFGAPLFEVALGGLILMLLVMAALFSSRGVASGAG